MWPHHPELLAAPVPRYTSYPTAAEFVDQLPQDAADRALAAVSPGEPVSLYVHIPFCERICWYCGCNTGASGRAARLGSYVAALEAEIDRTASLLGRHGRIDRIAFGGGSPNALPPATFLLLVERLRSAFDCPDAELSIELDPRSFTAEWAGVIGTLSVARASLGVQTFAPEIQAAIGRVQPVETIMDAMTLLRTAGVGSINFDLMYGLPGQSEAQLAETLDIAVDMRPDRIALFGYAHVPQLIARQRRIDSTALPTIDQRFSQSALGHRRLTEAGYQAIGFDHFALPDDALAVAARNGVLRRNFQGFTDDPAEVLIGLGASAISSFPGWLLQNEKNAGRYRMLASAGVATQTRGVARTAEDRRRGALIEQLLCAGRAQVSPIDRAAAASRLTRFETAGLIDWQGDELVIASRALPYARTIAAVFDAYRDPAGRQFSNAI